MSKAISVKNLWVVYRSLKSVSSKRALFTFGKNKLDIFEAVKDVSFDIEEGQVVGLVGRNGSGKSTLLRAIAGIFSADKGNINLYGKTVSLLSIGVGFKTNLSGRENIFLSGLLMGFKKSEIQEKLDSIIEFSAECTPSLLFQLQPLWKPILCLSTKYLASATKSLKRKATRRLRSLLAIKREPLLLFLTVWTPCKSFATILFGSITAF